MERAKGKGMEIKRKLSGVGFRPVDVCKKSYLKIIHDILFSLYPLPFPLSPSSKSLSPSPYRRLHQRTAAAANPIRGNISRDDNAKRFACAPVMLMRRFLTSLGRIERGC